MPKVIENWEKNLSSKFKNWPKLCKWMLKIIKKFDLENGNFHRKIKIFPFQQKIKSKKFKNSRSHNANKRIKNWETEKNSSKNFIPILNFTLKTRGKISLLGCWYVIVNYDVFDCPAYDGALNLLSHPDLLGWPTGIAGLHFDFLKLIRSLEIVSVVIFS